MLNTVAKIYLTIAFLALVAAIGYNIGADDSVGTTLFLFLMVVAGATGVVVAGTGINDRAPWVGDGAPITEVPVGAAGAPKPSSWPIVAGIGAATMGVGLAVNALLVVAGFIVLLLAAGGWLGQSWREDVRWDHRQSDRLAERFIAPVGIPLVAFTLILFVVVATSRVLLATSKNASVVVAIGLGVVVLGVFAVLALRPHVSRGVLTAVVAVAGVSLVSAGVAGAAIGEREFHPEEEHLTEVTLVAKDTQFNKTQLDVPAGEEFVLRLVNDDEAIYHNVGVYTALTGGSPVVAGEPVEGVAEIDYHFEVPDPGTYGFRCDFHVNMVGTLNVK